MTTRHFFFVVLILTLAATASADSSKDCVYTLYVQTGSIIKGGTDAKISVTLGDSGGRSVWIPNLKEWGVMHRGHDYFERGNLDIFTGRGRCLSPPICRMNLTSDGSGTHHGWFVDYIEVTFTGPHKPCSQTLFYFDRWLADDAPPFQLTAILDGCDQEMAQPKEERKGPLVVGKTVGSASQ